jgi:CheY-like chemotaxis protein
MKPRTILLIDSDQSTRRQRALMLLTHGYLVRALEKVENLELPFIGPAPDLVLLRVDEPHDRPDGAYEVIREAAPRQRIGFVLDDGHELCQVFVDGVLTRPREELASEQIEAVNTMLGTESVAQSAVVGS